MHVSEARIAANRANAQKSTGPRTPEGKAASRANGMTHGLAGSGPVVAERDRNEILARTREFERSLRPRSPMGAVLILKLATLSVRSERAADQELASVARNVRAAVDDYDESRHDEADQLFESLRDEPRKALRKLKRFPEGVDLLIEQWAELREDLARDVPSAWAAEQMVRAVLMTGHKEESAWGSRIGALSRAIGGDFLGLSRGDGSGLGEEARIAWAKARLAERIEAEIASLEAHRETLDHERFHLDRVEAPDRALFDPSKEATLARRYEAETSRGFYKALKEFHQAEAAHAALLEAAGDGVVAAELASLRDRVAAAEGWKVREAPWPSSADDSMEFDPAGMPLTVGRGPNPPR